MKSRRDLDVGIKITEEGIKKLKELIGVPLRCQQWSTVATKDAIRHWSWGIGDDNPLWLEEEYAQKTRWGCLIAQPIMLSIFGSVHGAVGLPGLHAQWTEDVWEFFQPVRVNDTITVSGCLVEVLDKPSVMAERMIEEITENIYRNQRGEIVGKVRSHNRRYGRAVAAQRGVHKGVVIRPYTEEEIKAIEEDYDKEERRGANPRYWDDVKVGDNMGHVVNGPLTVTDMIAFNRGSSHTHLIRAHRFALEYRRQHPRAGILNELGIPDVAERVHWDVNWAKEVGAPAPYDYAIQRIAWATHLFTNWMGDDGFLKKLHVQLRRMNYVGDTTWFRGKATNKLVKDGEHLVECEFWANNQRGERTTNGWGTVLLPSKAHPISS